MDAFVVQSLRRWQFRRGGQRPTKRPRFTWDRLYGMGLDQLMGTVRYPTQAALRRSSSSREPENGVHGLKGGHMETGWQQQPVPRHNPFMPTANIASQERELRARIANGSLHSKQGPPGRARAGIPNRSRCFQNCAAAQAIFHPSTE